jgi:response regulator of citrate/malate metabolism
MSSSQKINVVIVEDDPMVQRINEEFLRRISGFVCVGVFDTISKAKGYLEQSPVDLVLLDVFLPDGNGTDLLNWIRKKGLNQDVILITADKRGTTAQHARRYGAVDYLVKPFRFERFEESLNHYRHEVFDQRTDHDYDQETIDQMMNFQPVQPRESSKNLTLDAIYKLLKEHSKEGFTASSVAEELGISRITARRYLEELETKELVRMELSYGGVGRPQNLYYCI